MNDHLASVLTRIPEPAPPPTLAATVMARIAREADLEASVAGRTGRDDRWSGWLWAIAGTALVLGASIRAWLLDGTPPDLTSPRIGAGSMPLLSPEDPATLLLVLGLLLYLVGFFVPLRHKSRHTQDSAGR
jgi:hypothetical protein